MKLLTLTVVLGFLLVACPGPAPSPVPPTPGPEPAPGATPCEQSCVRHDEVCEKPLDRATCITTCEATLEMQREATGDVSWHPDCQARAMDCAAWRACRGDGT